MMPRFILAGSSAQLEIPMKATRHGFSSVSMTSSDKVTPSSNRGCNVLRGIRGESSARPTSSNTTTDTNLSKFLPSWSLRHCRNVATIPSGVESGLHWYEAMWTLKRSIQLNKLNGRKGTKGRKLEGKGKERKGKERKGKERKEKKRKGNERKRKERKES